MKLELANRTIFELLKEAHAKGEMIVTNERQRRLGKTKALMLFAEINQLPVIVRERQKDIIRKNTQTFIYSGMQKLPTLPDCL
ncbi:hypothetical protein EXD81_13045 [Bacillus amyloliquefaciens]|nr:hypothetical protein EXD81_13045 [Bacillus amyloliquefaciens]